MNLTLQDQAFLKRVCQQFSGPEVIASEDFESYSLTTCSGVVDSNLTGGTGWVAAPNIVQYALRSIVVHDFESYAETTDVDETTLTDDCWVTYPNIVQYLPRPAKSLASDDYESYTSPTEDVDETTLTGGTGWVSHPNLVQYIPRPSSSLAVHDFESYTSPTTDVDETTLTGGTGWVTYPNLVQYNPRPT